MLANLSVKNYALIDKLEISFSKGFSTITGETGAGKSILMGALSLILGQRSDTSILKSKGEKCVIEGLFIISERFRKLFEENDLDYESESLFRREISPQGKSRSFINDTPVNLQLMKLIGTQLVDIHSQHQNLQLNDQQYQLEVVDFVAGAASSLKKYRRFYEPFVDKRRELDQIKANYLKLKEDLDYMQFQFAELESANLISGELEELEFELKSLENAEEIKAGLAQSLESLANEGTGANDKLKEVAVLQQKLSKIFPPSIALSERFESAYIEIKDLIRELENLVEKTDLNPDRLGEVQERVNLLIGLMQKHRVNTLEDLIAVRDNLDEKISEITLSDERMSRLEKELADLEADIRISGEELHTLRVNAGKSVQKKIVGQLVQLGIPNARFEVKAELAEEFDINGMSHVNFMFSANKQSQLEEISRVASGGEVSRLMLSIKSLLSNHQDLPTLIFDEIDAGVSGEIADKVGNIMETLSSGRQVIAITHLPQVASKGADHFMVYKEDTETATFTKMKLLTEEERIIEIAKMLSGEEITEAALSNARELLKVRFFA